MMCHEQGIPGESASEGWLCDHVSQTHQTDLSCNLPASKAGVPGKEETWSSDIVLSTDPKGAPMENVFPHVLPQFPPLIGSCPGAPDMPIALDVFSTTAPSAMLPPVPH